MSSPQHKDATLTNCTIAEHDSFLSDVSVHPVVDGALDKLTQTTASVADRAAQTRKPLISRESTKVQLAIPIMRASELRGVTVFEGKVGGGSSGVFEIWMPHGDYHDLRLQDGYFGHLERFQNVSSYVRFETGTGLPGQAAAQGKAIIHDNLSSHPGFLRAAGASAGELQSALALPIFTPDFTASVLLLSSQASPLAKQLEVWQPQGDDFCLVTAARLGSAEPNALISPLPAGSKVSKGEGIVGAIAHAANSQLCSDVELLGQGRVPASKLCLGLPTFQGSQLNSIALMWL